MRAAAVTALQLTGAGLGADMIAVVAVVESEFSKCSGKWNQKEAVPMARRESKGRMGAAILFAGLALPRG